MIDSAHAIKISLRGPKDPSFALTQNIPYKQDAETSQRCSGNPPHRDNKTVFRSVSLWTTLRNERCWTLALFIPPATAVYGPQQPKNRSMEKARGGEEKVKLCSVLDELLQPLNIDRYFSDLLHNCVIYYSSDSIYFTSSFRRKFFN